MGEGEGGTYPDGPAPTIRRSTFEDLGEAIMPMVSNTAQSQIQIRKKIAAVKKPRCSLK
jgi:hypothetical protein